MLSFIFDLPSASDTMASMGTYAKPWFTELFPIAAAIAGILIAGAILGWLSYAIPDAINHLRHKDDL